ncbi:MAG: alpha/beta hydrolase [Candidatus Hodarchaeales archaeon]|jgi:carboxylesterase
MATKYIEGAEPLFIKGSNTGCLLLHGAGGGTTWDLKEFARTLHSKTGTTIWLPALKGFGTRPEDLLNVRFSDWMNDAHEGVTKLKQDCDRIFIVGHSMGGILALLLVSELKDISAVVTWASAFSVRTRKFTLLPIITKIPVLKSIIPEQYPTGMSKELKEKGWIGYDWIPSSIGFLILEGVKRLKQSFNKINSPAFIIQGTKDEDVSRNSAKKIYNAINSRIKDIWYVEGASHPIMLEELYKKELFARTIAFLETAQI